ncbi:MAG TPA: formate dehydrogenase accessory sulfurtransferase FdhD [Acidimicrobiia bacterium]|jgi:FdhD protein
MDATTTRRIRRWTRGHVTEATDVLVSEEPVEFRLGGVPIAVLMRTPGDEAELGLGFAITEGIVLGPEEVAAVEPATELGDRYDIVLSEGVTVDPEQFRRNLYTTSSCGVCGKASIDAVRVTARRPPSGPVVSPELLLSLPSRMRDTQDAFDATGGLHAAALFDPPGSLLAVCEDIGRHNAVDKLVGKVARARWPIGEAILVVSGRVSFEMVQKAAVAGIPVVCGVSAASSLAVELGEELGLTVVGFLREGGFNVYAGAHRVS